MSKAEKTREFIIEQSSTIFNKKGYANTSLSDIMEVTSLTKGSIYGNFKNKDEVAVEVYKFNVRRIDRKLAQAMDQATAAEKLVGFTEFYRNNCKQIFERGGCPLQNASIEADDSVDFLRRYVQVSIRNWAGHLSKVIEEGQKAQEFRKTVDALAYAYMFITLLEGGMMLSKIMNNQKFLHNALDRILLIVDQELKK